MNPDIEAALRTHEEAVSIFAKGQMLAEGIVAAGTRKKLVSLIEGQRDLGYEAGLRAAFNHLDGLSKKVAEPLHRVVEQCMDVIASLSAERGPIEPAP